MTTIIKDGYKLIHKPWLHRSPDGWEFTAYKPDGSLLMAGSRSTDDPDAEAIKQLDDCIHFGKMCLEADKMREAAPWVKHKSGCEIRIVGSPYPNRQNCFTFTIRKGGNELYHGSSRNGAGGALSNAKVVIKKKNY
jgi:hypothetical protein